MLNPLINQENCRDYFKLDVKSCLIPNITTLDKINKYWIRTNEAFFFNLEVMGVEVKNFVPSYESAKATLAKHNLAISTLNFEQIFTDQYLPKLSPLKLIHQIKRIINKNKKYHLAYPLVGGYAVLCIISSFNIKKFADYCGIFAATNLFVELAIPTAIALSAEKIETEKFNSYKGKILWETKDFEELNKYNSSLKTLLSNFPSKVLYIHPIKLSQWK